MKPCLASGCSHSSQLTAGAGQALDQFPLDTIEAVAREAVQDLRSEPRLSVRCAPELVEALSERLEETARNAGFDGAILVRGEDGLRSADVRLEWGAGAVQRSADEIDARLNDVVARWLASPPEEESQSSAPGHQAGASAA